MSAYVDVSDLAPAPPVNPSDIDSIGATLSQRDARATLRLPEQPEQTEQTEQTEPSAADVGGPFDWMFRKKPKPRAPAVFDATLVDLHLAGPMELVPIGKLYTTDAADDIDFSIAPEDQLHDFLKKLPHAHAIGGFTVPCPGRALMLGESHAQRAADAESGIVAYLSKPLDAGFSDVVALVLRMPELPTASLSAVQLTLCAIAINRGEEAVFEKPQLPLYGARVLEQCAKFEEFYVFVEGPSESTLLPYISLGRYTQKSFEKLDEPLLMLQPERVFGVDRDGEQILDKREAMNELFIDAFVEMDEDRGAVAMARFGLGVACNARNARDFKALADTHRQAWDELKKTRGYKGSMWPSPKNA